MTADGTDQVPSTAAFRLGEWLLEPSLDRLSRDGKVVHLRPQLTNLLVLLAQNAGRTVSKDEILSKVWAGQFVAESGMTRCIAEIRQALGDDARDPKIVETITKRGYRLVAPVVMVRVGPPLRVVEAEPTHFEPLASPPPRPEPTMDPMPDTPSPAVGHGAGQRVSTPLWLRQAAHLTLASLALAALLLALVPIVGGWIRTPALGERDTVLLADVINTTGDTAFDQTLRFALATHFGQAPFVRILPAGQMRAGLVMMGRGHDQPITGPVALELCRREGAAVLLAGSVARVGNRFVVGLEALACGSGESIDRQLIEVASKDDVLGALGSAAGRLRRTLGESRESLRRHDVPIVQGTTPSLEALKAVTLGDFARDHARPDEALMHYRRATELDAQFAAAWARRGAAAMRIGRLLGDDRSGETDEIDISFKTAFDLSARVSEAERFYILGHYYTIRAEPEKAIENYRLWSRVYPGSPVPPTNIASIYTNAFGRYTEALADAREAVRLAPSSSIATGVLVAALCGTNRRQDASQALREAARRGGDDLAWHRMAFEAAFSERDADGMAEQARWASSDPPAAMAITEARAMAAASRGRLAEARRFWGDASAIATKVAPASVRAGILLRQAETEALLGDARAARAAAEGALTLDGQALTLLAAAEALALAGDTRQAARLTGEVARRAAAPTISTSVWEPVARALVEAGNGRPALGLQVLAPTARFERGRQFGFAPLGVRASISRLAGQPAEAVAAFRELLSLHLVLPLSPWVVFAHLGLARALREAGDVAASRAAYDAVVEWMKGADPDAPILVAALRERSALR